MTTLMNMAPTINATTPEASEAWWSAAWMEKASCVTRDPELWFTNDDEEEQLALAVCRACPVLDTCLEDSLQEEGGKRPASRFGIRGGLLPRERFNVYSRRLTAARGGAS